jgi:hypothetical protein
LNDSVLTMLRCKITATALIGVLLSCPLTPAATITVTPAAGATYSTAGVFQSNGFVYDGSPHIYRVDIFTSVFDAKDTEGFGAVYFDVALSGGITRSSLNVTPGTGITVPKPNYTANNPLLLHTANDNSSLPIFAGGQAGDLGTSNADLVAVVAAIDPSNLGDASSISLPDPRLNIGKTAPFLLGTVYVLGGITPGHFITHDGSYSMAQAGGPRGVLTQSFDLSDGDLVIGVPEPNSGLLGVATLLAGLLVRRRLEFSGLDRLTTA